MVLNWIISWEIYVTLMKVDRANPFPNPLWVSMINSVIKMVARLVKRPKNLFICIFGLLSYRYNIYQVRIEFRKLFDVLVHPNIQGDCSTKKKTPFFVTGFSGAAVIGRLAVFFFVLKLREFIG